MSLERIIDSIKADAQRQIDNLRAEAEVAMAIYETDASSQCDEIRARARAEALLPLDETTSRMQQKVRNENIELLGSTCQTIQQQWMDAVKEALTTIRSNPQYAAHWQDWLQESLQQLAGSDCTLHIDPRDAEMAQRVLDDLKLQISIATDLHNFGGLVLVSNDGSHEIRNSIETRLHRIAAMCESLIAAMYEQSCGPGTTRPDP